MTHTNHRNRRRRQRYTAPTLPPATECDDLGDALDAVNAWGYLEDWRGRDVLPVNCYGPGVLRGLFPVAWAGVLIWYKPRGYYHYQTLNILGIWALRAEENAVDLRLATTTAAYKLAFFNVEAYFNRIQREFKTFYDSSGTPPQTPPLYSTRYDPARRLDIRRELLAALNACVDD